jgi:hypothetical protein
MCLSLKTRGTTHFLLRLEALDNGGELGENFVCLLVVLNLSGDKFGKVAQGLRCVENLIWSVRSCLTLCSFGRELTFFMTPTASSV